MKLLIGGSPCTYWSIAQTKNRETEASGMGWELFRNYVLARDKFEPDFFLYENNKSMSPAIRAQITEMLGVEPVLINSALVSAQNRQRLYWVGRRNADGGYDPIPIEQPEDRGILLRDVLESGVVWREKAYTIDSNYKTLGQQGFERQRGRRKMVAEPVNITEDGKAQTIKAQYAKNSIANFVGYTSTYGATGVAEPVKPLTEREMDYMVRETHDGRNHFDYAYHSDGTQDKSACLTANISKGVPYNVLCEPVCVASRGRYIGENGSVAQHYEVQESGKTNTLTTVQKDNLVAEPIAMRQVGRRINANGHRADYDESIDLEQRYEVNDDPQKTNCLSTVSKDNMVAEPVRIGTIENDAKTADFDSQQYRVYSPDGKSVALCGNGGGVGAKTWLYAVPTMRVPEATARGYADIAPGECVDLAQENSKTRRGRRMAEKSNCLTTSCQFYEYCGTLDYPIYQVKDGRITIEDKQYPIKLRDGCYIIRKLTVRECMRLQTVPEGFEFPVSDSQAYKMLGNGWTVDVIAHLLSHFDGITTEPVDVLSMYDGMACGHIALDKLGAEINFYVATEIDKYAIKTATHNFPDIIELGDAFQVRDENWRIPTWML